jgi:hypothetical protein
MHYVHLDTQMYRDARSIKHKKVFTILTVDSIREEWNLTVSQLERVRIFRGRGGFETVRV